MRTHRSPSGPSPFTFPRAATAAALTLAGLALAGCGSTPAPDAEEVPHRDTVAGGMADAAGATGGEAASQDVAILRKTSAANGSPALYTLILIEDASELPGPVGDALKPDFDKEAVVFFGMGRQDGPGYVADITAVRRNGAELTVAADARQPDASARGEPTTPWSAVVIPRQAGVTGPLLSDFN